MSGLRDERSFGGGSQPRAEKLIAVQNKKTDQDTTGGHSGASQPAWVGVIYGEPITDHDRGETGS